MEREKRGDSVCRINIQHFESVSVLSPLAVNVPESCLYRPILEHFSLMPILAVCIVIDVCKVARHICIWSDKIPDPGVIRHFGQLSLPSLRGR